MVTPSNRRKVSPKILGNITLNEWFLQSYNKGVIVVQICNYREDIVSGDHIP